MLGLKLIHVSNRDPWRRNKSSIIFCYVGIPIQLKEVFIASQTKQDICKQEWFKYDKYKLKRTDLLQT